MGKIYMIMGKSSSGKDTIFRHLLSQTQVPFETVVGYTTRPMREGENEGVEYHFVSEGQLQELEKAGKVIERRTYHTVYGDWHYFTADDGQIEIASEKKYLMLGTLESYDKVRGYYGKENVCPLYIEVEDGERLLRAIGRERTQDTPKYEEMCRRFLADAKDFSEEKLTECEIVKRYENLEVEQTVQTILLDVQQKG